MASDNNNMVASSLDQSRDLAESNETASSEEESNESIQSRIAQLRKTVVEGVSKLKLWLVENFAAIKPIYWSILCLAGVVLFAFFVVRPQDKVEDQITENAASAWNDAIEKLGMQPLYPPQEDFYVGDIYLTVSPSDEVKDRVDSTSVFEGRGVKIGHIDFRKPLSADKRLIHLTSTVGAEESGKPKAAAKRSELQYVNEQGAAETLPLSLVSFPGITIRTAIESEAGFKWFGLGRKTGTVEEVSIPVAETYAAPVIETILALGKFCQGETTKGYCQEQHARRVLQYALGRKVNALEDGKYIFDVNLLLVNQVYMTRSFGIRRINSDALAGQGSDKKNEETKPSAIAANSETAVRQTLDGVTVSGPATIGNSVSLNGVDGVSYGADRFSQLGLWKTFDYPLVFGFRAVTFSISTKTQQ